MTLHIRLSIALCSICIWQVGGAPTATLADITNWQTGETIPGTEGITPGPGMVLDRWNTDAQNLRYADFSGGLDIHGSMFRYVLIDFARFTEANLTGTYFGGSTLTGADLRYANLTNANLDRCTLIGADLTDATIAGASFWDTTSRGFTKQQLYSTASYKNRDLEGIGLGVEVWSWDFVGPNDLTGWNFAGQNLTGARFDHSVLAYADLTDAVVVGASFGATTATGFTKEQLYSTASYKDRNLEGIGLGAKGWGWDYVGPNDLTGWNLAGQNLTGANFRSSTLTGADLTDAVVAGANFRGTTASGFTPEQLSSTLSYQNRNLVGIQLEDNDLTGWDFAGQNLTGASLFESTLTGANLSHANLTGAELYRATLEGADLTDSVVAGASLSETTSRGFTSEQLYSTASYKNGDLAGIGLSSNDLTGWNFVGQDLTGASFYGARLTRADLRHANLTNAGLDYSTLTDADLTGADTRGARGTDFTAATVTNVILPYGHVVGLELGPGQTLVVRDYDGNPAVGIPPLPIHVEQQFVVDAWGMLQMLFEADAWDSTISFDPGIPVMLGGTLVLDFAPGVDLASQIGRTFDLFDWTGVAPSGQFAIASPYLWDVSSLYTAGQVTFVGIPEPSCIVLALVGISSMVFWQRRQ